MEEKPTSERGYYLHPEVFGRGVFGQDKEKGRGVRASHGEGV